METDPVPNPNDRALRAITNGLHYLEVRQQAEDEVSIGRSTDPWDSRRKIEMKNKKTKEKKKEAEKTPSTFDGDARRLDRCVLVGETWYWAWGRACWRRDLRY